jgi:hypothetical protein
VVLIVKGRQHFLKTSPPDGFWARIPSCPVGTGSSLPGHEVVYLRLVTRLRMCGGISPFPIRLRGVMLRHRENLTFLLKVLGIVGI